MSPTLLLALAAAQQIGPEEAIAAQRTEVRAAMRIECPPGAGDEDIVVCGRGSGGGGEAYRVPFVPEPGRIARLPGEAPTGGDALAADRCIRLCNEGVKIDVIGAIRGIQRGLDRILHPD